MLAGCSSPLSEGASVLKDKRRLGMEGKSFSLKIYLHEVKFSVFLKK